jgi:hypothetical protein
MNDRPRPSIAELLADNSIITAAIGRGVREALLEHARAGRAVPSWQEGKVVWIPPEEILARLADGQADGQPT